MYVIRFYFTVGDLLKLENNYGSPTSDHSPHQSAMLIILNKIVGCQIFQDKI